MKKLINITMIMWVLMFFMMLVITSCSGGGDTETVVVYQSAPDEPEIPVNTAEKFYTISSIPSADFYYFTDSNQLYKFSEGGLVTPVIMSVIIEQENEETITQTFTLNQFFRIGSTLYFSTTIDGKDFYCSQSGGILEVIDESVFPDEPARNRITMNNGHFSIVTGQWTVYEISDVRNLTLSSGIARTLYVSAYYLANSYYGQNGMFFVCHDNGVTMPLTSGLYFYPENSMSPNKINIEAGEMW